MTLPLDHIVIAVHDLTAAIDSYRQLGFTVHPGGHHPGRATHNALVVFDDGAYFELIAWNAPEPDHPWWPRLAQHGAGIVDFALLPGTTTTVVEQARARGLDYHSPVHGGRQRPDGVALRWHNARPRSADLPFLCGDLTPRALRVPEGPVRQHANGTTGVAALHVAVLDLASSLQRYQALLGADTVVQRTPYAATLELGRTRVHLHTRDDHPQAAHRLARAGEGPYAIELRTSQAHQLPAPDVAHTHGAHITWQAAPLAQPQEHPQAHTHPAASTTAQA